MSRETAASEARISLIAMDPMTTLSHAMSDAPHRDQSPDANLTWPGAGAEHPPRDHPYRAALWLLGRHPRLARLAGRISGLVNVDDDGEPTIDIDHLGDVFGADPVAWTL